MLARGLSLVLATVVLFAGCSGDGTPTGKASDDGRPPPDQPSSSTTAPAGCGPAEADRPPAGAAPRSAVELDADGDGEPDTAGTFDGPDGWGLFIDAPGGGRAPIPLEDRTAEARALGGHDIDGDGAEELFLQIGAGASASSVAVARIVDCEPVLVTGAAGGPAQAHPVGSSAATANGLSCEGTFLDVRTATTDDGETYRWTETRLRLDGATFVVADRRQGTWTRPDDDARIVAAGSLQCGDVTL